ncbi:MAG TPA: DnaJ C-terminal domain-containing protein [Opitutaceae bacterium]
MPASSSHDYYALLGVAPDAGEKAIRDAFRELALKYHPDRSREPGAEAKFREIAEAYAVLSDPRKRAAYDSAGAAGVAGLSAEDLFGGIDFDEVLSGRGFGLGQSVFDRFLRRRGLPRGEDLVVDLDISLAQVATGGEEVVRVVRVSPCPDCRGSGAKTGTTRRICKTCEGAGRKVTARREGGATVQQITACPECDGRGYFIDEPCFKCAGRGEVAREETLTVQVPPGIDEGMTLRVPGRGQPSSDPKGKPGDLLVVARSLPDPRFERRGEHLWHDEKIGIPAAVLGAIVEVPTLDGTVGITIPPGTQPDTVLRLRGRGLPRFGGRGRGDLYVRVQVRVPQRLSAEERRLYAQLKKLGR